MNDINVLSLFDGMSCGQIALKRLGIIPRVYYASEIDKHAIGQTQLNFPNTIQLGSVVDVDVSQLERIDLLIGGSPCQSFSFAGKRKGMATKCEIEITKLNQYMELKEQGFEFEGQSYLFWEYMRILTDIRKYNPDVLFLLENVEMGAKWERVLSQAIGVLGVHINSALVSAQNRKRIYWTNIRTRHEGLFGEVHSDIPQPEDRGILLRDILESEVLDKYYLSDNMLNYFNKRAANFNNGKVNVRNEHDKATTLCASMSSCDISDNFVLGIPDKSFCIDANYHKGASVNQYLEKHRRQLVSIAIPEATEKGYIEVHPGECFDAENMKSATRRGRKMKDKSNCLMAKETDFMHFTPEQRIRRLTPTECARLQTVPDWYKWACSDTQQYRMLGNGWTVEVIAHIFSFLPKHFKNGIIAKIAKQVQTV